MADIDCDFCRRYHQERRPAHPCLCGDTVCALRWCLEGDQHRMAGPPVFSLGEELYAEEVTINARLMHEAYGLPAWFFMPEDGKEFTPEEIARVIYHLVQYEAALNAIWLGYYAADRDDSE